MDNLIVGSGGGGKGGGGGGRTAVEAPNSLKSIQYAQIIDVISEGEIKGLVNGPSSIFLDDVPLTEFSEAVYEVRTGTQTQAVTTAGLQGSKTTIEVGRLVRKYLEGGSNPGHVIEAIDVAHYDAGAKSIDVTIGIPVLTHQDMSNGDINGTSISFKISISTNGGGYNTVHETTISGKCTSMYNASYNVPIDSFDRYAYPLSIKMERITDDSSKSALQNQIYWSSYTVNYPTKLNYPNTALVTLTIDSDHFTSIPVRSYDIYGMKVKIPTNYSPTTRVYSGTWDGTFKIDWTDNPAWIYYDLVTDTRYGIGEYITEDKVDKWELYTIGKYCDELVSNGLGGYEPRFTCNLYIQSQDEAFRVLSDLCSIFRGMQFYAGGFFSVSADRPRDAVHEFSPSNVIDGVFNYSGSSLKTRHTAVKVIWNDPTNGYKQKVEYVEANGFVFDQANPSYAFSPINTYGIVQTDIVAVGCTSRGQANRVGRWLLYTELYETETVTFKTGIENAVLFPGNIIKTADPFRQGRRMGGRVSKILSTSTIELDSLEGDLTNGTYNVSFIVPTIDPNTKINKSSLVSYIGNISTLGGKKVFATTVLNPTIVENTMWVASLASSLEPELWRVVSITQEDEITASIVALEYHPNKFAAIEQGMLLEERPVSQIDYGKPSPPITNALSDRYGVYDLYYPGIKSKLISGITASSTTIPCESTAAFNSSGFIRIDNELIQYTGKTSTSFTGINRGIEDLLPAYPHVPSSEIEQVTRTNLNTSWVKEYLFFQSPGLLGTAAALSWSANSPSYEVKYKRVLADSTSWEQKISNVPFIELKPLEPGIYDIEIRAVNTIGRRSDPLKRTIKLLGKSVPPLNVIDFTSTKTPAGIVLSWSANNSNNLTYPDLDLAGYEVREVYYSALPATMIELNNEVNWAPSTTIEQKIALWNASEKATDGLLSTTTYTDSSAAANKYNVFLIRAKDTSNNYSEVPSICGKKINPPEAITNASISINGTDLVATWEPPKSDVAISYYTISYNDGETSNTIKCSIPEFRQKLWFMGYETFDIIAYDISGNSSPVRSIEIAVGTLPAPTFNTPTISGENYVLSWSAPNTSGCAPVDYYEIRVDQNWGSNGGLIAKVTGTTFSAKVDWIGNKLVYISARDTSGHYGISTSRTINSPIPGPVGSFIPTVIDNNVLLSWTIPSTGTELPIVEYEVRKGPSWESALSIGTKAGLFTTQLETVGNTYTYWIAAINSAGTIGIPRSITAVVNQPPDYVLNTNYFSDYENTYGTNGSISTSNAHKGIDGKLILPVDTTQTWTTHFTSKGYDQIQDFVNSGYVSYMEPITSTGYYQEVVDLGTLISGSTINIAINKENLSGSPVVSYEVSVSADNITYTGVSSELINYFTQFRYVKFKVTVTGGLVKLNTLNFRIDIKQKSDAGSKQCNYADSGGTIVYLTVDRLPSGTKIFKDVISINLTPNTGCTNSAGTVINTVTPIYDFIDTPDPLSFKILLLNSTNGERLSGSCSYTVRGV